MQTHILFDFAIKDKKSNKKREQIVNNLSDIQEIRWNFVLLQLLLDG